MEISTGAGGYGPPSEPIDRSPLGGRVREDDDAGGIPSRQAEGKDAVVGTKQPQVLGNKLTSRWRETANTFSTDGLFVWSTVSQSLAAIVVPLP